MDLKDLDLTEDDFKLIIDSLETVARASDATKMAMKAVGDLLSGDDPVRKAIADKLRIKYEKKLDDKHDKTIEDIRILQAKILLLKRKFQTDGALKQASDIINKNQ